MSAYTLPSSHPGDGSGDSKDDGGDGGRGKGKKKVCGWMGVDEDDDLEDDEQEDGEVYSDFEDGSNIVSPVASGDEPGCSRSSGGSSSDAGGELSGMADTAECFSFTTEDVTPNCSVDDKQLSSSQQAEVCSEQENVGTVAVETPMDTADSSESCTLPHHSVTTTSNSDTSNIADDASEETSDGALKDSTKPLDELSGEPQMDPKKPLEDVQKDTPPSAAPTPLEAVDLANFASSKELESVGLEVLKFSLTELGLKCGGTLQERAQRLFSTKNVPRDQIDPSLFAGKGKGKGKKQKK